MKSKLIKLNNIKEKLEDKLEDIEWDFYFGRSKRWRESEATQIHDDKISALDSAIMSIDDAIDELSSAFNLKDLF